MSGEPIKDTPDPAATTAAAVVAPAEVASPSGVGSAPATPTPAADAAPAVSAEAPAAPAAPAVMPSIFETFEAEKKAAADAEKAEAEKLKAAATVEAEAKPAATEKPEGEAAPKAVDPVAYEYKLPETLSLDEEMRGEVHAALDAFRADPTKGVQGLVDLHARELEKFATNYAAETTRRQFEVFNDTRRSWLEEIKSDPELGGSGFTKSMNNALAVRDRFVADGDERAEFNAMLRTTGVGESKSFIRFMNNVWKAFREPGLPPPNARPSPNANVPPNRTRAERLYGTNGGQS